MPVYLPAACLLGILHSSFYLYLPCLLLGVLGPLLVIGARRAAQAAAATARVPGPPLFHRVPPRAGRRRR